MSPAPLLEFPARKSHLLQATFWRWLVLALVLAGGSVAQHTDIVTTLAALLGGSDIALQGPAVYLFSESSSYNVSTGTHTVTGTGSEVPLHGQAASSNDTYTLLDWTSGPLIRLQPGSSVVLRNLALRVASLSLGTASTLLQPVFSFGAGAQVQLVNVTLLADTCGELQTYVKLLCAARTWRFTTEVQVLRGEVLYGNHSLAGGALLLQGVRATCPDEQPAPWTCGALAARDLASFAGAAAELLSGDYVDTAIINVAGNVTLDPASWHQGQVATSKQLLLLGNPSSPAQLDFAGVVGAFAMGRATWWKRTPGSVRVSDLTLLGLAYPAEFAVRRDLLAGLVHALYYFVPGADGRLLLGVFPDPVTYVTLQRVTLVLNDDELLWWRVTLQAASQELDPETAPPELSALFVLPVSVSIVPEPSIDGYSITIGQLDDGTAGSRLPQYSYSSCRMISYSLFGGEVSEGAMSAAVQQWPLHEQDQLQLTGQQIRLGLFKTLSTHRSFADELQACTPMGTLVVPSETISWRMLDEEASGGNGTYLRVDQPGEDMGSQVEFTSFCMLRGPVAAMLPEQRPTFLDLRGVTGQVLLGNASKLTLSHMVLYNLAPGGALPEGQGFAQEGSYEWLEVWARANGQMLSPPTGVSLMMSRRALLVTYNGAGSTYGVYGSSLPMEPPSPPTLPPKPPSPPAPPSPALPPPPVLAPPGLEAGLANLTFPLWYFGMPFNLDPTTETLHLELDSVTLVVPELELLLLRKVLRAMGRLPAQAGAPATASSTSHLRRSRSRAVLSATSVAIGAVGSTAATAPASPPSGMAESMQRRRVRHRRLHGHLGIGGGSGGRALTQSLQVAAPPPPVVPVEVSGEEGVVVPGKGAQLLKLLFKGVTTVDWYTNDTMYFSLINGGRWLGRRIAVTSTPPPQTPTVAMKYAVTYDPAGYPPPSPPPPSVPPLPQPQPPASTLPSTPPDGLGAPLNVDVLPPLVSPPQPPPTQPGSFGATAGAGGSSKQPSDGASSSGGDKEDSSWKLTVAVAVPVGAVGLLAVCALVALWARRRRAHRCNFASACTVTLDAQHNEEDDALRAGGAVRMVSRQVWGEDGAARGAAQGAIEGPATSPKKDSPADLDRIPSSGGTSSAAVFSDSGVAQASAARAPALQTVAEASAEVLLEAGIMIQLASRSVADGRPNAGRSPSLDPRTIVRLCEDDLERLQRTVAAAGSPAAAIALLAAASNVSFAAERPLPATLAPPMGTGTASTSYGAATQGAYGSGTSGPEGGGAAQAIVPLQLIVMEELAAAACHGHHGPLPLPAQRAGTGTPAGRRPGSGGPPAASPAAPGAVDTSSSKLPAMDLTLVMMGRRCQEAELLLTGSLLRTQDIESGFDEYITKTDPSANFLLGKPGLGGADTNTDSANANKKSANNAVGTTANTANNTQHQRMRGLASAAGSQKDLAAAISALQAELADKAQQLQIHNVLGMGSFGVVYLGTWRGLRVAVKTLVVHDALLGPEARRRQRAILEAAISASLHHPNIVTTYAYEVKQLGVVAPGSPLLATTPAAGTQSPAVQLTDGGDTGGTKGSPAFVSADDGWGGADVHKLYIIQEYCEGGTLRDALQSNVCGAVEAGGAAALTALTLALNIALGMAHIHTRHIVHGDLSSANILLKKLPAAGGTGGEAGSTAAALTTGGSDLPPLSGTSATSESGRWRPPVVAKVADFGLSVRMNEGQTHASNKWQGTPLYAAPEVLQRGHLTKAADVYSFGVILMELYYGAYTADIRARRAAGRPMGMHASVRGPPSTHFQHLMAACVSPEPATRPTFEQASELLRQLVDEVQADLLRGSLRRPHRQPSLAASFSMRAASGTPRTAAATAAIWAGSDGSMSLAML